MVQREQRPTRLGSIGIRHYGCGTHRFRGPRRRDSQAGSPIEMVSLQRPADVGGSSRRGRLCCPGMDECPNRESASHHCRRGACPSSRSFARWMGGIARHISSVGHPIEGRLGGMDAQAKFYSAKMGSAFQWPNSRKNKGCRLGVILRPHLVLHACSSEESRLPTGGWTAKQQLPQSESHNGAVWVRLGCQRSFRPDSRCCRVAQCI